MASTHPAAYRPFRVAVYLLFIAIAAFGAVLFLMSVVRNVKAPVGGGERPVATPGQPLSAAAYRTCYDRFSALHDRLDDRFYSLGALASRQGSAGLRVWQDFSKEWEARLERTVRECGVGEGASGDARAERLETLDDALVDLHRLYSEHATRLLGDDGDTIQAAQQAFDRARP